MLFRVGIQVEILNLVRFERLKCPKHQYTDLIYMGGAGSCGPTRIIFGSDILSWYISLNIKFGVNRMFHVLKTPEYRFDLYGRYRTL